MKPFLILQLRTNNKASDGEFQAILKYSDLTPDDIVRIRMENDSLPNVNLDQFSGVFIGGGPWNVSDAADKKSEKQIEVEAWLAKLLKRIIARDFPVLGVCYGLGIISKTISGAVEKKYGEAVEAVEIHLTPEAQDDPLFSKFPKKFWTFAGHKESCTKLPEGAVLLASSDICPNHAFRIKQNIYATQFHPELDVSGMCERIGIYKHAGYFLPKDADRLKEAASKVEITTPTKLLRRFTKRYRS